MSTQNAIMLYVVCCSLILIANLVLALRHQIKKRNEFEDKCKGLIVDQRNFLTALWCMQCSLPLASWREYVRGLHGNLIAVVEFGDQWAAERALGIMICSADISTVRRLRDNIESTRLLQLLVTIAPVIKGYHNADRSRPGWPDDDAIYGVIAVISNRRPVLAIADPCTKEDLTSGNTWLNSKE